MCDGCVCDVEGEFVVFLIDLWWIWDIFEKYLWWINISWIKLLVMMVELKFGSKVMKLFGYYFVVKFVWKSVYVIKINISLFLLWVYFKSVGCVFCMLFFW